MDTAYNEVMLTSLSQIHECPCLLIGVQIMVMCVIFFSNKTLHFAM